MQHPRFEMPGEYDHLLNQADSFLPPQTEEEYKQFIEYQQPQIDQVAKMFDALKERTGKTEDGDVLLEALAIFDWATQEAKRGRVIISVEADSSNPLQLNTPSLKYCREIYRTHLSYRLEDINPKAASELFPAPPGLIPPEDPKLLE